MFGNRKKIEALEKRISELEAEKSGLVSKVEELEAKAEVPEPSTPPEPKKRFQYKDVWTKLSDTERGAVIHVIGDVDEETIRNEANNTVGRLQETVGIKETDTTLEIGCGIARVGQALAPLCQKWIGCDVSPNMLKLAEERLQGVDNYELAEISGYDLSPIEDSSIDLVYCTVVFMHLEEWDRCNYVMEAFRVLKPGGRLFVDNVTMATDEGWPIFDAHRKIAPADRPPHITKCSTCDELETYLMRAGFESVSTRYQTAWAHAWGSKPQ